MCVCVCVCVCVYEFTIYSNYIFICLFNVSNCHIVFRCVLEIYLRVNVCLKRNYFWYTQTLIFFICIIWRASIPPPKKKKNEKYNFFLSLSKFIIFFYVDLSLFSWGCRMQQQHISWEVRPPLSTGVLDLLLNQQMVRLLSWNFGECGVPFHWHYSPVQSDSEWVPWMGQIEIFNHFLYLKPLNFV